MAKPKERRHFTREIISGFFEKEKVLRTLTGTEYDVYRNGIEREFFDHVRVENDESPFEQDGKWGVRNNVLGLVTIRPVYDEIIPMDWEVWDMESKRYLYGRSKVRVGDKYGLVYSSPKGEGVICQPVYDDIQVYEDPDREWIEPWAYVLWKDGKCGLVLHSESILEPICDRIVCYKNDWFVIEKDGKFGLYDGQLVAPEYDEVQVPLALGWIKARKGNVWGYFDADCRFTEDVGRASLMRNTSIYSCDCPAEEKVKTLIDHFSEFLEREFWFSEVDLEEDICYLGEDKYSDDLGLCEALDLEKRRYIQGPKGMGLRNVVTGVDLIPPVYEELWRDSQLMIYCYKRDGKIGFVDADGKGTELCPPIYDEIKTSEYCCEIALVRIGSKWGFINPWDDNAGEHKFQVEAVYDEILFAGEYYKHLLLKKDGKVGAYVDGIMAAPVYVPPVYDGVFVPDVFGWVRVCKDGEWGYLDVDNQYTPDVEKAFLITFN